MSLRRGPAGTVALIREGAVIGAESVVGHASSVGRGAVIGDRVRIMSKVGISPSTRIEDDVFIASLVVTVDVGAGAVVSRSAPPGILVRGQPARATGEAPAG